eukprot:TRINITY_DN6797_c0_g1_i1.p1 TRINITY_DN6797_c0_g1~~TRINITY_DN6797_c0_g1_i1.p1  ORF type:complete len:519 (+),score=162.35 TRINITY_DN6797_c0_g1_i1:2-1558(+)
MALFSDLPDLLASTTAVLRALEDRVDKELGAEAADSTPPRTADDDDDGALLETVDFNIPAHLLQETSVIPRVSSTDSGARTASSAPAPAPTPAAGSGAVVLSVDGICGVLAPAQAEWLRQHLDRLQRQARSAEKRASSVDADLAALRSEAVQRVQGLEKRLAALQRERDQLRDEQQSSSREAGTLARREAEVAELRAEGEKLSRQVHAAEEALKTVRQRAREEAQAAQSVATRLGEMEQANAGLVRDLEAARAAQDELAERVAQLQDQCETYSAQLAARGSEAAGALDRAREMEAAVQKALRQQAEQRRACEKAQQEAREAEAETQRVAAQLAAAKRQVAELTERERVQAGVVADLRAALGKATSESGAQADGLRQELSELRKQLAAAEQRRDALAAAMPLATQPLLREIQALKESSAAAAAAHAEAVRRLEDQLQQTEGELHTLVEAHQRLKQHESEQGHALAALQGQESALRSQLAEALERAEQLGQQVAVLEPQVREWQHRAAAAAAQVEFVLRG